MGEIDQHEEPISSTKGRGETFASVIERRLSRRAFLKTAVASTAIVVAGQQATQAAPARAQEPGTRLAFNSIAPSISDQMEVAEGHSVVPLLRWGDPITLDAPDFNPSAQTAAAQEKQFGYNCDFVGFLPVPYGSNRSDLGLLVVNHEYTNPELMFASYNAESPTREQVDIELAAHGLSVVQVRRDGGRWVYDRIGANRRITATTPMRVSGPAADHAWMRTTADTSGATVLGTLNNCAAGKTPWGTVVSAEENFHQYFGNLNGLANDDPRKRVHTRYGVTPAASERKWERFYDRFDVAREPNEAFRFGWSVEIDPYDPGMTPVKRTALGRFRHEAQTFVVTPSGRVAVYSGDDERFEYIYKFVTAGAYNPNNRLANMSLLDSGTLYVAKLNDDGSGQWLPLVYGQGPLTEANGFTSQGDVLIKTRLAGDVLGATKMDRPEDIETNPVTGKVYVVLTNNTNRGTEGRPAADRANPRAQNRYGHIIELTEAGNDHAATTFRWDIFMLCGDPKDEGTYFAGFPKEQVSIIANPDNITFDMAGNMWISTDGQPSSLKLNDGLFAVPVDGPDRGFLRQFFAGVPGGEVSGPEFNPDNTALFMAIQHPGEGGTVEKPVSVWPGAGPLPRPTVVVAWANNGGRVGMYGSSLPAPSTAASQPAVPPGTAPGAQPGREAPQPSAPIPQAPTQPGPVAGAPGAPQIPASLPNTGDEGGPSIWTAAAGLAAAAAGAVLRRRARAASDTERPNADEQ